MDARRFARDPGDSFNCVTCGGDGGVHIDGVCYLELTCPTCHGLSRGCSAEEYWNQLAQDAEFDEKYNAYWLDRLRRDKRK